MAPVRLTRLRRTPRGSAWGVSSPAAILDVDGTLVDNNYQHALAWHLALRREDIVVPVWKIHRAVGIGGDKLIAEVAGDEVEERVGDAVREHESEIFESMIADVAAIEGATEFVRSLKEKGRTVIVASSGSAKDIERFIDLLEIGDLLDGWTTSDDVDASKPEPDLIEVALEKAGGGPAIVVGDTPWDVKAAERAGIDTIAVLSGGFPEADLREAGAKEIYESVDDLRKQLDDSPLG
jgi:HAD superfamily hydrolase (TIGR01509 family)